MINLIQPPTLKHLSRMYYELAQLGARAIGEKEEWPYDYALKEELLILGSQMSRYDPRLLSILVEYFYRNWKRINPLELKILLKQANTPQTVCVILNFLTRTHDKEYLDYYEYITKEYKPVPHQLYFIDLYSPGSNNMKQASKKSLSEYYEWGFLARERPIIHKAQRMSLGHWGPESRKNIIQDLAHNNINFTISDYLKKIDNTITRQQALIDLKNTSNIELKGRKKGSHWVLK
ncbi:hypothetical protein KJ708_02140 [bacterium]|nr:hypothetical protein [bacterium]